MDRFINVKRNRAVIFRIDKEVFILLVENTIMHRSKDYLYALESEDIRFRDFIELSRKGEIPYPLFFLEIQFVKRIVEEYKKKVFFGVSKDQLSISTRGDLVLADISLILKDITRKQNFIKKSVLNDNAISGKYNRTTKSIVSQASEIRELLGYNIGVVEKLNKEKTFSLLDKGLADQNVYISIYVHNYSPQTIANALQFSGVAINDKKCPFLFIKAGDNDSSIELWGRRLFTAALLLSCLLHNDCRPVTMDSRCGALINNDHYLFAEEFLMPTIIFQNETCSSIDELYSLSCKYSVSPSAILMRLFRLDKVKLEEKDRYFDILQKSWSEIIANKQHGKKISAETAIKRYNNRAFVEFVIRKHAVKDISLREARNLLCYQKGEKVDLEALRNVK